MKKQLLFGSILLATITAFSQNGRVKPRPSGATNMAEILAQKFAAEPENTTPENKPSTTPVSNTVDQSVSAPAGEAFAASQPPSSANWALLCGSMNVYGMLVSTSRPLQYNDDLNAVSFVHRKSESYNETPVLPANARAGVMVAEVSGNWGTTWDSTCFWANTDNWARYPQGAIYNPPGNSSISNAYIVGSGPTTGTGSWTGSWYASKSLAAFNTTADVTPNAQQFISFTTTTYSPTQARHGWPRYGFSVTDDNVVRTLGLIQNDHTTLGTAAGMRGVAVVKGTFNAGVFNWTTDTLIPSCIKNKDSAKILTSAPQMVWNESGSHGYVIIPGAVSGATLNNKGVHPIIYKTTTSGASWVQVQGIDFNAPAMTPILDHIASINTTTDITIPYFIDWDATMDANNNLHLGAILCSAYSNHDDSLFYLSNFTISVNPGHNYRWGHSPGFRPYVYDFTGDGSSAWKHTLIDSLWTEDPGAVSSATGYSLNPWDATGTNGAKISCDSRLQLGRTPDGKYVTYSWADSDTNFTQGQLKYNTNPHITARCMRVDTAFTLSPSEIVVTKLAVTSASVSGKAYLHYMSPTTGAATEYTAAMSNTVDINTPFTVTNNNNIPLQQLTNNTTWYGKTTLSWVFPNIVGIEENSLSLINSAIYPNPAKDQAILSVELKDNAAVTIDVYSIVGQSVKTISAQGRQGENNINIDLNNLPAGVYMVNVKIGKASTTKKLIIQ